ncbi:hypothetical protein, partial [Treponema sp.]|uniref:hypothetical protein n=1 Tax=Treponema sp. TaxID=166 RepID=UPI00298D988E
SVFTGRSAQNGLEKFAGDCSGRNDVRTLQYAEDFMRVLIRFLKKYDIIEERSIRWKIIRTDLSG